MERKFALFQSMLQIIKYYKADEEEKKRTDIFIQRSHFSIHGEKKITKHLIHKS